MTLSNELPNVEVKEGAHGELVHVVKKDELETNEGEPIEALPAEVEEVVEKALPPPPPKRKEPVRRVSVEPSAQKGLPQQARPLEVAPAKVLREAAPIFAESAYGFVPIMPLRRVILKHPELVGSIVEQESGAWIARATAKDSRKGVVPFELVVGGETAQQAHDAFTMALQGAGYLPEEE